MSRVMIAAVALLFTQLPARGQTVVLSGDELPPVAAGQSVAVRALAQRLPVAAFAEVPFDQVVEWLADATKLNVVVRWELLAGVGLERDKAVSLRMTNVSVAMFLWLVLRDVGGEDVKLAYRASGRMIVISTREDLERDMITRVYDVADLLLIVPRFANSPRINASQALGTTTGGSPPFDAPGEGDEYLEPRGVGGASPAMQALIDAIQAGVDPDSWVANGGNGTIAVLGSQLIVRNHAFAHQQLGGYLRE